MSGMLCMVSLFHMQLVAVDVPFHLMGSRGRDVIDEMV